MAPTSILDSSSSSTPPPLVLHHSLDLSWLVANKPAGMVVHDGDSSLVDELARAGAPGMHPCHRLDAETTGVILLSERGKTAGEITAALASATKVYRGIVRGQMPLGRSRGRWKQTLTGKAEGRKNPRGKSAYRVEAVTEYQVVASTRYLSVVDFTLRTGRTHQIRKHAAINSHHLLGDTRYGDPKHAAQMERRFGFGGMALHAARLSITINGEEHDFEAPLPDAWKPLLAEFEEEDQEGAGDAGEDAGEDAHGAVSRARSPLPAMLARDSSRSNQEGASSDSDEQRQPPRMSERRAPKCV